jgi:hypothetical protein
MEHINEHRFVTLDAPVPCAKCRKKTTVVFTEDLCSGCAGVWTREQRAKMAVTRRKPYPTHQRPRAVKRSENRYKAAPGSEL